VTENQLRAMIDSGLVRQQHQLPFTGDGRQVTERGVAASAVVPDLEPLEAGRPGGGGRRPRLGVDRSASKVAKERSATALSRQSPERPIERVRTMGQLQDAEYLNASTTSS
jgi:hypothetical protein